MKNVINSIRMLFDKENKIRFKNPLNGETKEYQAFLWIFLKFPIGQGLVKKGWFQVDTKGMKIISGNKSPTGKF